MGGRKEKWGTSRAGRVACASTPFVPRLVAPVIDFDVVRSALHPPRPATVLADDLRRRSSPVIPSTSPTSRSSVSCSPTAAVLAHDIHHLGERYASQSASTSPACSSTSRSPGCNETSGGPSRSSHPPQNCPDTRLKSTPMMPHSPYPPTSNPIGFTSSHFDDLHGRR